MVKSTSHETSHNVCYECCVAPLLKELVVRHGKKTKCSLCEIDNVTCINTGLDEFLLAIKALIRYHFGEWQYHSKLGDGSLEGLFFIDPNPFLKINPKQSDIDREDVVLSFLDDVNERQMQVNVITAYGREIYQYLPHIPISSGESDILSNAKSALFERNYFLVEDEYEAILRPIVPFITATVDAGSVWYRARMGAKRRAAKYKDMGGPPTYYFEPHKNKEISSPPVGLATAGRVNRPGVSYLYLASNNSTAAAEIRPHPGEHISLGQFEVLNNISVIDLRSHELTKLWRNDDELEKLELIIAMENVFAMAAPPSNRSAYTLTQFLGELFRRLGFDGVLYRSTVGDGYNLVAFNPADAKWIADSGRAMNVTKVSYELEAVQLFDEDESYDIDFDDK